MNTNYGRTTFTISQPQNLEFYQIMLVAGCVCERQQPQRVADGALGVRASEAECRPQDRQQHAAKQEVELLPGGQLVQP